MSSCPDAFPIADEKSFESSTEHLMRFPTSFAQQRLWFLDQLEPGNPAFNVQIALRLTGQLNAAVLEQSFSEIVRRHETLRTTFAVVEGELFQFISPAQRTRLAVVHLRELPSSEADALRLATQEAEQSFDLARGPLLRVKLLRLGELQHVLVLTMHHIINDAWSTGVLFQELGPLYNAFSAGKPSPLPELPIQYADFAYWQRQWLQGDLLENELSYWKKQLGGSLPLLELPTDHPRPAVQSSKGARHFFTLSKDLADVLKALSFQEGVTLFMVLLAAFKVLLCAYTGQEDIIVGTPIAGRKQVETEGLIGFFVNPLVMRTDLSGDPTFQELLRRVREVALGAFAHQDLPFEKLVDALQPERNLSRTPLFQVWFALRNTPIPDLELTGLTLSPLVADSDQLDSGPRGAVRHDLRLGLSLGSHGLAGSVEYRTDLFEESTIVRMVRHYEAVLRNVGEKTGIRLSSLVRELAQVDRQQQVVSTKRIREASLQKLKTVKRKIAC
jgi:condensation domain-containing protein